MLRMWYKPRILFILKFINSSYIKDIQLLHFIKLFKISIFKMFLFWKSQTLVGNFWATLYNITFWKNKYTK